MGLLTDVYCITPYLIVRLLLVLKKLLAKLQRCEISFMEPPQYLEGTWSLLIKPYIHSNSFRSDFIRDFLGEEKLRSVVRKNSSSCEVRFGAESCPWDGTKAQKVMTKFILDNANFDITSLATVAAQGAKAFGI